jgi:hypothetical protein
VNARTLILTAAAVAALGFAGSASAQITANANATVTLRVYSNLVLTKNSDLNLGITNPGTDKTVAATAAAAGKFTVGGQASVPVTVTYPSSVSLTSGANSLSFAPEINGHSADAQGSSAAVSSGSSVTTSASGAYYVWLGGTATVAAAQPTGTYAGTFTLSIAY